jgi:NAD(P)-dependent dehydrogenase (short-subunit alcohol dehydrogenase family)
MSGLVREKVVVVTGGASGIGRAVCRRAAEEGARAVVVVDRSETAREGGPTTVELLQELDNPQAFNRTH